MAKVVARHHRGLIADASDAAKRLAQYAIERAKLKETWDSEEAARLGYCSATEFARASKLSYSRACAVLLDMYRRGQVERVRVRNTHGAPSWWYREKVRANSVSAQSPAPKF